MEATMTGAARVAGRICSRTAGTATGDRHPGAARHPRHDRPDGRPPSGLPAEPGGVVAHAAHPARDNGPGILLPLTRRVMRSGRPGQRAGSGSGRSGSDRRFPGMAGPAGRSDRTSFRVADAVARTGAEVLPALVLRPAQPGQEARLPDKGRDAMARKDGRHDHGGGADVGLLPGPRADHEEQPALAATRCRWDAWPSPKEPPTQEACGLRLHAGVPGLFDRLRSRGPTRKRRRAIRAAARRFPSISGGERRARRWPERSSAGNTPATP